MKNYPALKQILALILALLPLWVANHYFSDDGSKDVPKKSTVTEKSINSTGSKSREIFTVTRVASGDMIYVKDSSGQSSRIRFLGIDAPETKMEYGKQSQKALKKILDAAGKKVQVVYKERDVHNRIIGKVIADGKDVNYEMIKSGNAWYFKRYAKDVDPADRKLYAEADKEARAKKLGLWADPDPVPPWEWRKANPREN